MIHALAKNGINIDVIKFPTYITQIRRKSTMDLIKGKIELVNDTMITSKTAISVGIPYGEKYFGWLKSRSIYNLLRLMTIVTVPRIKFENYDAVIVESGKCVFFYDILSKINIPIIYRQSDSIELIGSKNPLFINDEHRLIELSDLTLVVNNNVLNYYQQKYPKYANKMIVWESGFCVPENFSVKVAHDKLQHTAIYFGIYPIDIELLVKVAKKTPNVHYIIIGPDISTKTSQTVTQECPNVEFRGFTPQEEALPLIANCSVAIMPYVNGRVHEYSYLTSKFLLCMYFGVPIVTVDYGLLKKLASYGIHVAKDADEFADYILQLTKDSTKKRYNYNIDFSYYSREGREQELIKIFRKHGLI